MRRARSTSSAAAARFAAGGWVYNFRNPKRKFRLNNSQHEQGGNMMTKSAMILLIFLPSILLVTAQELPNAAASQAPLAGQAASSGSLKQIIPGHYVYSMTNAGRVF